MSEVDVLKSLWGLSDLQVADGERRTAYAVMEIGGESWNFTMRYDSIVTDRFLNWKVRFDRFPDKEIDVSVTFSGDSDKAVLTVRQSGLDSDQERDANKESWQAALQRLEQLVSCWPLYLPPQFSPSSVNVHTGSR